MDKNNICFDYEKLFGLPHSVGGQVWNDLIQRFSHADGAFIDDDPNGRRTAYQLGQQSVINYILAQINSASKEAEKENNV